MVFQNNLLMGAGGVAEAYEIDESCRFNDDDSAYTGAASPTPTSERIFTFSFWVKRANIGSEMYIWTNERDDGGNTWGGIYFQADDTLRWRAENTSGTAILERVTNAVFRDPGAWYHIVCVCDSNQTDSTAADIYVNGTVQTYSSTTNPGSAQDLGWPSTAEPFEVGRLFNNTYYLDAYLANFYFIDGQELAPSDFGKINSITGQWVPKEYSGTFGNAGLFLDFSVAPGTGDGAGTDSSGNDNDLTDSGLAAADQVVDTPTDNFATWNGVASTTNPATLSDGNLTALRSSDGTDIERSTIAVLASGNWYAEFTIDATGSGSHIWSVGVIKSDDVELYVTDEPRLGDAAEGYAYTTNWSSTPVPHKANNGTETSYGSAGSASDIIGVHLSSGALTFYHNNSTQGAAFSGLSGNFLFGWSGQGGSKVTANYGQTGFNYTPPTGAVGISTANLDAPTTADPSAYFQPTIYTGDGESSLAVNQGGNSTFEPDFVWIKNRDATDDHILTDSVRGATKLISSNNTDAESTDADTLLSFDSDGFSVGADVKVNTAGEKYVGWQWLESTTSAFDIVSYTGNGSVRTISHNLGVKPDMMIFKRLDGTQNWGVYHHVITADYVMVLDLTNAKTDDAAVFNDTEPTSSVFTVNTDGKVNANTQTYIAYLFAGVEGFGKFGSYKGNGSTDGPFVWCGFKPAYVMTKRTNDVGDWKTWDNQRTTYNVITTSLAANTNEVDSTGTAQYIDFLSNGFKIRGNDTETNGDGSTYVFAAFADTPFKTATAR